MPSKGAPATPTAQQASIVRAFKQAWQANDIGALIGPLDPDATAIADGGGQVSAALGPIQGGGQIAGYLAELAGRAPSNVTILERRVNGQPGLVAQQDGVTWWCWRSTWQATRSPASGRYATPTSSGPGRPADARHQTIGSAASRRCLQAPACPAPRPARPASATLMPAPRTASRR